jgi:hypothetical protein
MAGTAAHLVDRAVSGAARAKSARRPRRGFTLVRRALSSSRAPSSRVPFLVRHGEVEASPVGRELPTQGATQRIVEADQRTRRCLSTDSCSPPSRRPCDPLRNRKKRAKPAFLHVIAGRFTNLLRRTPVIYPATAPNAPRFPASPCHPSNSRLKSDPPRSIF